MFDKLKIYSLLLASTLCAVPCQTAVLADDKDKTPPPSLLQPGSNLVLEGVPKPSLQLVDEINKYTEFRRAIFSDWHPGPLKMLIETRFGDANQVHLVEKPGGARTQLTFFRDATHGALYQPTAGDFFIFNKDKGGDEFFQKYKYSPLAKSVELLTDGKSRNTGGVWSHSGQQYAFGSTRRNGKDVDIFVLTGEKGGERLLCEGSGGGWNVSDWTWDNKTLLLQDETSVNESRLWMVDATSGQKTAFLPVDPAARVYYGQSLFSPDGKGVFVITDNGSEFLRLAYVDLQTKEHTYLTDSIHWDILEFDISDDGAKLAFVANEDGLCTLHLLDTATKKELTLPAIPPGQVSNVRWHKNSRDLAFNVENAQCPSDVYSLNVTNNQIDRWTHSETGMVDLSKATEPKLIHWKSFDGRQISGFLYQPANFDGKRPVLINIHGGPESQWRPRFLGVSNYLLDKLGIAIVYPNVRGSLGYGKTFSQLDNGLKRQDSYKDIATLIEWIKSVPDLDSDRIMLMGGSYGGNMTLACSMLYSDKIKCSLDAFGPSDFVTFLKNTQSYRQDLRRAEYGDERDPKVAEFLGEIAPARHAEMIKKPLFVVQGDNDPRVPVSESDQMVKAVRAAGTPVWYLKAKDEGHGFAKKINNDFLFFTVVEFIKQYLLSDTNKAAGQPATEAN